MIYMIEGTYFCASRDPGQYTCLFALIVPIVFALLGSCINNLSNNFWPSSSEITHIIISCGSYKICQEFFCDKGRKELHVSKSSCQFHMSEKSFGFWKIMTIYPPYHFLFPQWTLLGAGTTVRLAVSYLEFVTIYWLCATVLIQSCKYMILWVCYCNTH